MKIFGLIAFTLLVSCAFAQELKFELQYEPFKHFIYEVDSRETTGTLTVSQMRARHVGSGTVYESDIKTTHEGVDYYRISTRLDPAVYAITYHWRWQEHGTTDFSVHVTTTKTREPLDLIIQPVPEILASSREEFLRDYFGVAGATEVQINLAIEMLRKSAILGYRDRIAAKAGGLDQLKGVIE